jgi:hypothetical protein
VAAGVEFDTTKLQRAMRELVDGIERGARTGARTAAEQCAQKMRDNTPYRTGALESTIGVTGEPDGSGVTYGGGLRYAWYIEGRNHPVARAVDGADDSFARDMHEMAANVAGRL